jgi:hypothetical protein
VIVGVVSGLSETRCDVLYYPDSSAVFSLVVWMEVLS